MTNPENPAILFERDPETDLEDAANHFIQALIELDLAISLPMGEGEACEIVRSRHPLSANTRINVSDITQMPGVFIGGERERTGDTIKYIFTRDSVDPEGFGTAYLVFSKNNMLNSTVTKGWPGGEAAFIDEVNSTIEAAIEDKKRTERYLGQHSVFDQDPSVPGSISIIQKRDGV